MSTAIILFCVFARGPAVSINLEISEYTENGQLVRLADRLDLCESLDGRPAVEAWVALQGVRT